MTHRCHARGCEEIVPPHLLICRKHWFMVPKPLRKEVWRTYRKGQEATRDPSPDYLVAARRAIDVVAARERPA